MTSEDRATLARIVIILSTTCPATLGVLHSITLLDGLIGEPGSPERRAAFETAHLEQQFHQH